MKEMLLKYDVAILYKPMLDEIDPYILINNLYTEVFVIPQDKDSDPFLQSKKLVDLYRNKKVFVIIPGKYFDVFGNRKGRGGGWYDRFLSSIPSSWLRIGIINESNFSYARLKTNHWDEPVDCIVSCGEVTRFYITNARQS